MSKGFVTFDEERDRFRIGMSDRRRCGYITFESIDALDNFMQRLGELRYKMEKAEEETNGVDQES